MQESRTIQFQVCDTFLLRSALLPLTVLEQISSSNEVQSILTEYYSRDDCKEALYLASPGLYSKVNQLLRDGKIDEKAERKLLQYLIRMASRCTPFGSFAGVCSGTFGIQNEVILGSTDKHVYHFRPDMQFLCQLSQQIQNDRSIREGLKFISNSTLYKLGEDYRYIEHHTNSNGERKYILNNTPCNQALEQILDKTGDFIDFNSLIGILTKNGTAHDEAVEYIHALIDNKVLVSEIEPSVSGKGFYNLLKERIGENKTHHTLLKLFQEISQEVDTLRLKKSKERPAIIDSLIEKAKNSGFEVKENAFIQADMRLASKKCSLIHNIKDDLYSVTAAQIKLSRVQSNPLMESFKKKFVNRYGEVEVPLSLAMDAEAGPGYLPDDKLCGNDILLDELKLSTRNTGVRNIDWSEIDALLHAKHQQALMENRYEIEISDADLDALPAHRHRIPISISLLVRILNTGVGDKEVPTLYFNSAGGSSALKLAGRFAYLDVKLEKCLKDIATIEQKANSNAVFAEIVHLPEERTGNVLIRPVFYPYEIPFLAKPAVGQEKCLTIDDLMVSVKDDVVKLRSKKLDRFIVPRLSNAHNYSIGKLSLYRFLCDLQTEGYTTYLGFSWGPLEEEYFFLPRVTYRSHILGAARWNLPKSIISSLKEANNQSVFQERLNELRERFNIPREVLLVEFDNELWLDLENPACSRILFYELRNKDKLRLMEFLNPGRDAIVRSDDGSHANEFLFFLHQNPVII